jgi:hypothetical protein
METPTWKFKTGDLIKPDSGPPNIILVSDHFIGILNSPTYRLYSVGNGSTFYMRCDDIDGHCILAEE